MSGDWLKPAAAEAAELQPAAPKATGWDPTAGSRGNWPRPAASAVVLRDDTVLLVERGKGVARGIWSLPGGHIEPGETARDAACREVAEETGITMRILGLCDVHDVLIRTEEGALSAHYVLAVFFGAWLAGEPRAADDARDARFVALGDLAPYRLTQPVTDAIARSTALLPTTRVQSKEP